MRNIAVALVVTFLTTFASASTVDVYAWPLSAHKPQSLAKLSYNSTHATVSNYSPLTIPVGDEIVRVGFYHGGNTWAGVATAASNFGAGKERKVLLHVDARGEVYHIGFKAVDVIGSGKGVKGGEGLGVEVVQMQTGPTPHLNKPVVLTADGKVDEKVEEKTFFQK